MKYERKTFKLPDSVKKINGQIRYFNDKTHQKQVDSPIFPTAIMSYEPVAMHTL